MRRRKNFASDQKSDLHLFNGLDELFHHAKFVEDRTTRAGCRCENVVFVRPMALFVRGWHNLKKYCVMVYGSILMQSTSYFSEWIDVSESSHFCR